MSQKILIILIILILGIFIHTFQVKSDVPCSPTDEVIAWLKKTGESRIWRGLSKRGHITEIWVDKKTGRWTAVTRLADGRSCVPDLGGFSELLLKEEPDV